ncbi:MAG: PQQ-binding-like beta-propeller repeat protein [Rickettsiales bacterium]|nr:PQQ-binding-like beta-propeller repeat protein [Rickettsiales bacterium]
MFGMFQDNNGVETKQQSFDKDNKPILLGKNQTNNQIWVPATLPNGNLKLSHKLGKMKRYTLGEGMNPEIGVLDSIIILGTQLYYMDYDKELYRYDTTNLKNPLWRVSLLDEERDAAVFVGGSIAYGQGVIYATNGSFEVYALDATTGEIKWRRDFKTPFRTAPAVSDNTIIVTDLHNKSYGLDPDDGTIQWIHSGINEQTVSIGGASAVINNNVAIIPHSSGEVYGVNVEDGSTVWSRTLVFNNNTSFTLSDIDHPLVLDGRFVYAASNSGLLAAIDTLTGRRLWSFNQNNINSFWSADQYIFVRSQSNIITCIDKRNGMVLWKTSLKPFLDEEEQVYGPTLVNNNLLFVTNEGKLLFFSYNGQFSNEMNVKIDDVYYRPIVANERLFLLSNKGQVLVSDL